MDLKLEARRATIDDLGAIVNLLIEDELGFEREKLSDKLDQNYIDAFALIDSDPNQYLMVVELEDEIIATCHLNIMPSLTFTGSTRMQIEAVRVSEKLRGHKIGEWMINQAIEYAKLRNASIIQLTTNIKRLRAKTFYERLGFESTHVGMKLYLGDKK
jgi:ribosomal protein S18 acetylase RimI-like enzyme